MSAQKIETAKNLRLTADTHRTKGEYESALKLYLQALQIFEEVSSKENIANILFDIAIVCGMAKKYQASIKYYKNAIVFYTELHNKENLAKCYNNMAKIYSEIAEFDLSIENLEYSMNLRKELGDTKGYIRTIENVGKVYEQQGKLTLALEKYQECHKLAEEIDDQFSIQVALNNIGVVHYNINDYESALKYLGDSLSINKKIGEKKNEAKLLLNIGIIHFIRENYPMALEYCRVCLKINSELNDKPQMAVVYNNIGNIYLKMEDYFAALKNYNDALKIRTELGILPAIASSLYTIGTLYLTIADFPKAFDHLIKSLELQKKTGNKLGEVKTLQAVGELMSKVPKDSNYNFPMSEIECLTSALDLAKEFTEIDVEAKLHQQLSESYKFIQEYQKALEHYEDFFDLKTQMLKIEAEEKIKNLQLMSEIKQARLEAENYRLQNEELELRVQDRTKQLYETNDQLKQEIDNRYKIELELEKALKKEKEFLNAKSDFVQMMSHEFRTPMTVILSSSELLLHPKLDEEKKQRLIDRIRKTVKNTTEILDSILLVEKHTEFAHEPTDAIEVVNMSKQICEELASSYMNKHIVTVTSDYDEVYAKIHAIGYRHIITHLVNNALKYSPEGEEIIVSVSQNEDVVTLSVADNGIGIPEKERAIIFEAFRRGENQLQGTVSGVGLGLYIVKQILDIINGKVFFTSEVGKGSTFFVELPIVKNTKPTKQFEIEAEIL